LIRNRSPVALLYSRIFEFMDIACMVAATEDFLRALPRAFYGGTIVRRERSEEIEFLAAVQGSLGSNGTEKAAKE
jgi:hypothetical protein